MTISLWGRRFLTFPIGFGSAYCVFSMVSFVGIVAFEVGVQKLPPRNND